MQSSIRLKRKRILIVEDDDSMHLFLRTILDDLGYELLHARNGNEGLAHYHKHQPDLILTDLHMPNRSGIELIAMVRSHDKLIPILAMTSSSPFTKANATHAGANAFLKKPFTPNMLTEQIADLLHDG